MRSSLSTRMKVWMGSRISWSGTSVDSIEQEFYTVTVLVVVPDVVVIDAELGLRGCEVMMTRGWLRSLVSFSVASRV